MEEFKALVKFGFIFIMLLHTTDCGYQRASDTNIYTMDFHVLENKMPDGVKGKYSMFFIIF